MHYRIASPITCFAIISGLINLSKKIFFNVRLGRFLFLLLLLICLHQEERRRTLKLPFEEFCFFLYRSLKP